MSKKDEEKKKLSIAREEEEKLIRRAASGDINAYGTLIGIYQQRVFNLIGRFINRQEVVEDLAQEVFIKAFKKIDGFRLESSFFTWIYAITVNTCRNFYRSQGPAMIPLEGNIDYRDAVNNSGAEMPEALAFRRQRAELVRKALDQLPKEQNEVLVMCDLEGLSYQEIAQILDVPVGTVRSRIFRARQALRLLLPEDLLKE